LRRHPIFQRPLRTWLHVSPYRTSLPPWRQYRTLPHLTSPPRDLLLRTFPRCTTIVGRRRARSELSVITPTAPTVIRRKARRRPRPTSIPRSSCAIRLSRVCPLARNPAIRSLSRSTFGGNFGQSDFARAWNRPGPHRHFGFVLGFVGPLFWPYAFEDLSDYTFSPYAYDAFWPYAFDDVFAGIYGGYAPDFAARAATLTDSNSQICSGQARGLTDFPIERIAKQVDPDQDQLTLLEDLKAATAKTVSILQAACRRAR